MWALIYCDFNELEVVAIFENKPNVEDLSKFLKNADKSFIDSIFSNACEFYFLREGDFVRNESR